MKINKIVGTAAILLTSAMVLTACSNNNQNNTAKRTSSSTVSKKSEPLFGFHNTKTYTGDNGLMTFSKMELVSVHDSHFEKPNYKVIMLSGTFKNKSSKPISVKDFWMNNFKLSQKTSKGTHDLSTNPGVQDDDYLLPWKNKTAIIDDKIDKGKTIAFTLSFDINKDNGDKPDITKFLITPIDDNTQEAISKPLKITAETTSYNVPKSNDDD